MITCVIIQQVIPDHSYGGGHRVPKSTKLPKATMLQCFPMTKVSHVAKVKFKEEKESLPLTEKNHNITLQGGMHSGVGKRSGHFCNSPQRGKPCYLSLQRKNSRFTGYRDPPSEDITEISIPKVVPLKGKKYLDSFKALVLHGSNCKNPLTYKD